MDIRDAAIDENVKGRSHCIASSRKMWLRESFHLNDIMTH